MKYIFLLLAVAQVSASFFDRHVANDRNTFVHLFEWRWDDIAKECRDFLPQNGYGAVQVSPPMEHAVIYDGNVKQPWWQRYQPVSYKLVSRSGNQQQFTSMVETCNKAGVRIYVDAVINHMTGGQSGKGSAGSPYNGNTLYYPGVPYGPGDFNGKDRCHNSDLEIHGSDYDHNVEAVRNCRLSGLRDLNQGKSYVSQKIADYMNQLIDIGVAGFRIDAAKHMWPQDLSNIYHKLHNLNTKYFPANKRPYIFQEVIDYSDWVLNQYENLAGVTEFKYAQFLAQAVKRSGKSLSLLKVFGEKWRGFAPSRSAVVFTDNHDSERDYACKSGVITSRDSRAYKIAYTFALAWPYGFPKVLSGYRWPIQCSGDQDQNRWIGPPHESNYETKHVVVNKDNICLGGWTCTHRWRQIFNMARFRNVVGQSNVMNWWDNGKHQISFSRGNLGFVVINNDDYDLSRTVKTGLPQGTYCDIISGKKENGQCTGKKIYVDSSSNAKIFIKKSDKDPMMATHVEAKLGDGKPTVSKKPGKVYTDVPTGTKSPTLEPPVRPAANFSRTVIFVHKRVQYGHNLFIRGGLDQQRVSGCTQSVETSRCAIPIKHRLSTRSATYESWKKGDFYLDWYGAESGQGTFKGFAASGSPMLWTTNDISNIFYHPLNHYGPDYWVLDVDMDCSRAKNYWFEAKAMYDNGWEADIHQSSPCSGDDKDTAPWPSSKNHVLKCGEVNVVDFNQGKCDISHFK